MTKIRFLVIAALASALSLHPVLSLQANIFQGFQPVQEFQLEVGGEIDPGAKIYLQRRAPAYLVQPSGSNRPLLLVPRAKTVQAVNVMKVKMKGNGEIDLEPDAAIGAQVQLELDASGVHFELEGTEYRLRDKPDLLGLMPASGLEDFADSYSRLAEAYRPDADEIAAIKALAKDVRVRVYFGSWCPFCQQYLPRMIGVERDLAGSAVEIDYYGLPRRIGDDPVSETMRINAVPTGVVFVDGKEAGRINNDEWRSPETALKEILEGR